MFLWGESCNSQVMQGEMDWVWNGIDCFLLSSLHDIIVRGAKLYNKATPYCVCTLLDSQGGLISTQVQKTKAVQTSCTNPVWEQLLELYVFIFVYVIFNNDVWEHILIFVLWDSDVSTDFHGFKLECYDKRKLRADKLIGQVTLKVHKLEMPITHIFLTP